MLSVALAMSRHSALGIEYNCTLVWSFFQAPWPPFWAHEVCLPSAMLSQSFLHVGLHLWCITVPHIMVCVWYLAIYLQYDTVIQGSRCMMGRDFSIPLAGFSMKKARGLKSCIISKAFWTRLSAYSKSLGVLALLLAMLY